MATGIAAAMLTELQGLARVHPVFELTLSGTTHRFASQPIASESQGAYEPFVTNWGIIERSAGAARDYSLQNPRTTVDIYDQDRVLQKAIGGPSSGAIIDSTAKIILRSFNVAQASHYTLVDGIVADYRLAGNRLCQFVLTPDDRALRVSGNEIPTILPHDWPRAPDASYGTDGQAVYGEHHSTAIEGATGLINCTMIDEDNNYWYVSIGSVSDVVNVWRNGTLATSDFTLSTWTLSTGVVSVIKDDTDTSTSSDTITADVDGTEETTNWTMITDPIEVLEDFFSNYTSVSTNATHLAETQNFLSDRGHVCAKVVKSSDKPLDVLNDICKSYKVAPMWSWDWTLGIRPFNPAPSTIYVDSRHIHQRKALSEIQGKNHRQLSTPRRLECLRFSTEGARSGSHAHFRDR
jgi:hypothetical protein